MAVEKLEHQVLSSFSSVGAGLGAIAGLASLGGAPPLFGGGGGGVAFAGGA